MTSGFSEGELGGVVEVVLQGRWTPAAAEPFTSGRAQRLVVNHALGADEPDLGFLEGLPVRELVVLDRRVRSLKPVEALGANLSKLSVTTHPSAVLDLGRLPGLLELAAEWSQVRGSWASASASGLLRAALRGYTAADLIPLGAAPGLVQVDLKDRPRLESLRGASALPALRRLAVVGAAALTDIDDLRTLGRLEELELEACRGVGALDAVADCRALTRFNASDCGDVASLRPLRDLARLRHLRLYGTTRVLDGDLSVLADLPVLEDLRMRSRREYRPSVAEIQALRPRVSPGAGPDE
ncbi:hypothetical protein ENKNEFLB_00465 [Nocardioides aquaticus]|uniref:Leucine-rich repeat domain-containing protein n=1 Tax=Nocardioides aquaticus TaxID=160826 RepID=A0ABX8EHF1_9ACTN|nr:hypothetical protein [Nocardioides aquaticus]QVT78093.1 hypothetical protein ENKNEFLB_00465 [Nocardioides aquaticus]